MEEIDKKYGRIFLGRSRGVILSKKRERERERETGTGRDVADQREQAERLTLRQIRNVLPAEVKIYLSRGLGRLPLSFPHLRVLAHPRDERSERCRVRKSGRKRGGATRVSEGEEGTLRPVWRPSARSRQLFRLFLPFLWSQRGDRSSVRSARARAA